MIFPPKSLAEENPKQAGLKGAGGWKMLVGKCIHGSKIVVA